MDFETASNDRIEQGLLADEAQIARLRAYGTQKPGDLTAAAPVCVGS